MSGPCVTCTVDQEGGSGVETLATLPRAVCGTEVTRGLSPLINERM